MTTSLLDVQVEDTTSRRAITLSNAVALGYVAYSKQLAAQSGDNLVRALQARATKLNGQLNDLEAQVTDQAAKVGGAPPGECAGRQRRTPT